MCTRCRVQLNWQSYKGYHGDTSATYFCGYVDDKAKNLVQVTKESLDKAISVCAPDVEFNSIGKVIK
nr:methionine aminopeptidase 1D, chloroplastic/mitochondrial [Tanacetum cinerariifolium]